MKTTGIKFSLYGPLILNKLEIEEPRKYLKGSCSYIFIIIRLLGGITE